MGLFQIVLILNLFLVLLLIVPFGDNHKQKIIVFLSSTKFFSTAKYFYFIVLVVVVCVFAESFLDARSFRELGPMDAGYLSKTLNCYITGFIIAISLVLFKLLSLIRDAGRLKISDEALKRQAMSASEALNAVMEDQSVLKKENDAMKVVLYGDGKKPVSSSKQNVAAFEEIKKLSEKLVNRNAF
ncbi:b-cell receptor-associated protein [Bonamia ostreae]|uniref:B-cell receptor-associated protein n=1 Tax=Bonamia ostreae TaxID=126728 RepID=A0ABV2ANK9_9EUKA